MRTWKHIQIYKRILIWVPTLIRIYAQKYEYNKDTCMKMKMETNTDMEIDMDTCVDMKIDMKIYMDADTEMYVDIENIY